MFLVTRAWALVFRLQALLFRKIFGLKAACTAVTWGFCKILVLVLQVYLGLYPVWQAS